MNGPKHYETAEDLLRRADMSINRVEAMFLTAMAQTHATLAVAAATIDAGAGQDLTGENRDREIVVMHVPADLQAWSEVLQ